MGLLEISALSRLSTASYISFTFGTVVSLFLFYVAYQTLLHPLRAYPGPFIAKLTDAHAARNGIKKHLHLTTYRDHLKYGSVFRPAPNRLVFNTIAAVHDIYMNPGVNKGHVYSQTQFYKTANIFGTLDRDVRRQKRKVYNRILSDQSMREFEPTMVHEIDIFLQQLLKDVGSPVNMAPRCERLAVDVAGQLGFGQALHTQTQTKNRNLPKSMKGINYLMSVFMAWPLLGTLWPILKRLSQKSNGSKLHSTIGTVIQARRGLPKDAKHDFYKIASSPSTSPDEGLVGSALWAEAAFIIPAGGTTVTTALSAAFFYLSRHREVYDRLAGEIRGTFATGRDIQTGAALSGCRYLRAVIDEVLRVAPPATTTLWREAYADYGKELVVDGCVIPRGVMVGVSPYSVMHNGEYFKEPFVFRPERWIPVEDGGTASAEELVVMRKAHVGFAMGETGCLGKGMAYMEIGLVLAKTLWYFDFGRAEGEAGRLGGGGGKGAGEGRERADEYQLFDILTADSDGPILVFEARGEGWKELVE